MEEDFVGNKYMIFAEDAPWKAHIYLAFYLEVFNAVVSRG